MRWRGDRWRDLRTFAKGAACGALAGVVMALMLVRSGADGIRARSQGQEQIAALERPNDVAGDRDDTGREVPPDATAHGAAGTSGRVQPAPPPEEVAVTGSTEESAPDLEARDLAMPVEGVTSDSLTRQFDDPRGASRRHEAIDILAPRNTPVKAVDDGTIARLFDSAGGGITIYQFDPSREYCYYYAHLERYATGLKEGDRIRKGQIIGYVGTSGNAPPDTPHLHFAIFRLNASKRWWEGTPIDPYDVLR